MRIILSEERKETEISKEKSEADRDGWGGCSINQSRDRQNSTICSISKSRSPTKEQS